VAAADGEFPVDAPVADLHLYPRTDGVPVRARLLEA
jgi:hypothetical protein